MTTIDKKRECIRATVSDAMTDLLYYDRKEDNELPVDAIEAALANGIVSVDELVAIVRDRFEAALRRGSW